MPHLSVALVVRLGRIRKRAVRSSPGVHRRVVVGGGAQERMPEDDTTLCDVDDSRVFGRLELAELQAVRPAGAADETDALRDAGSGDRQRLPCALREDPDAPGKRALQSFGHRKRLGERLRPGPLSVRERCRQLEQRERVAACHVVERIGNRVRERDGATKQLERRRPLETRQAQLARGR